MLDEQISGIPRQLAAKNRLKCGLAKVRPGVAAIEHRVWTIGRADGITAPRPLELAKPS
jgi:hypothetical protein